MSNEKEEIPNDKIPSSKPNKNENSSNDKQNNNNTGVNIMNINDLINKMNNNSAQNNLAKKRERTEPISANSMKLDEQLSSQSKKQAQCKFLSFYNP